ncbi:hypothetical protein CRYUN_Cryun35bG0063000 [Craigia yunnanensis]
MTVHILEINYNKGHDCTPWNCPGSLLSSFSWCLWKRYNSNHDQYCRHSGSRGCTPYDQCVPLICLLQTLLIFLLNTPCSLPLHQW